MMARYRDEDSYGPTRPRDDGVDGLALFRQLADYPVGSQPVDTSEDAADRITRTGTHAKYRLLCLQRLARGPITADGMCEELEQIGGVRVEKNTIAPRFTELVAEGFAERSAVRTPTRSGSPAHCYAITAQGASYLRELGAIAKTKGTVWGSSK